MFHTYVLAASGTVVDFDRASFLMDRELLQQSLDAMRDERDRRPRSDATSDAQWVWDDYCQRHRQQYGEGFVCDVTPGWDQQPEQTHEPCSEAEKAEAVKANAPLTAEPVEMEVAKIQALKPEMERQNIEGVSLPGTEGSSLDDAHTASRRDGRSMTSAQFKAWRDHMGYSQAGAATALGLSKGAIENYDRGYRVADKRPVTIPKPVELACAALALGIRHYAGPT